MTVETTAKTPPATVQGSTESEADASKKVVTPDPKAAAAAPPKVEAKKEETAPKVEEKKPDTAPPPVEIKYDEVKAPEGSTLKPEDVESVKAFAKENGLSIKQAQAQLKRESDAVAARAASDQAQHVTKVAGWKDAVKLDKELGGEFLERTALRTKAALRFDTTGELSKLLDDTGLGNLPQVVRYLEKIGAASEDSKLIKPPPVVGGPASKSDGEVFYGGGKKE